MTRNAGGRLLTSKQVEKLDGDWDLIQLVCKESEKAINLVQKSLRGQRFHKKEIRKSLNLMKKHHQQVKHSFRQKSTVLKKLSPRAANYVQSKLKSYDGELEDITDYLNKWPWHFVVGLWHFGLRFERFASSYKNFGLEVRMYRDLVKNTTRLMT